MYIKHVVFNLSGYVLEIAIPAMTTITDKPFPRTVTIQSTSNDSDPKKSSTDERSLPAESTLGKIETPNKTNVLASLGPGRKNLLLLCFCLS